MTDDELLKALRDTARAEHAGLATLPTPLPTLDPALIDRLTDVAMRELAASSTDVTNGSRIKEAQVRSLQSRRPQGFAWVLPVAAAAAVLFAVLRAPSAAPISTYRVEIARGSEQTTRGADSQTHTLTWRPGAPFELALRPASKASGAITTRVYLAEGAELRALPVRVEVTASGMVRVYGNLPASLNATASRASILGVVGRPNALPEPAKLLTRSETETDPAFQIFRIEIRAPRP